MYLTEREQREHAAAQSKLFAQIESLANYNPNCFTVEDGEMVYIFTHHNTYANVFVLHNAGDVYLDEIDIISTDEPWRDGCTPRFEKRCRDWVTEHCMPCPSCGDTECLDADDGECENCGAYTFCPECLTPVDPWNWTVEVQSKEEVTVTLPCGYQFQCSMATKFGCDRDYSLTVAEWQEEV